MKDCYGHAHIYSIQQKILWSVVTHFPINFKTLLHVRTVYQTPLNSCPASNANKYRALTLNPLTGGSLLLTQMVREAFRGMLQKE